MPPLLEENLSVGTTLEPLWHQALHRLIKGVRRSVHTDISYKPTRLLNSLLVLISCPEIDKWLVTTDKVSTRIMNIVIEELTNIL